MRQLRARLVVLLRKLGDGRGRNKRMVEMEREAKERIQAWSRWSACGAIDLSDRRHMTFPLFFVGSFSVELPASGRSPNRNGGV